MKVNVITMVYVLWALNLSGCFVHHEQAEVLLKGIDVDQTLKIAEMELKENKMSSVLTFWAVRDQVFTLKQAEEASRLYFKYIDKIDAKDHKARNFSVWHFTWAVSNIYREGNAEVKAAMEDARRDAQVRVKKLDSRIATKNFHGKKLLTGDIHFMGRSYAKKHLVVPGNKKYVQSLDAYKHSIAND
jgi:hypothetical protein